MSLVVPMTRERATRIGRRLIVAMTATLPACSGQVLSNRLQASADGGGASGFQAADDGSVRSVSVTLSPSAPTVCAGSCVDVTPEVAGGVGPYTVRWSDGTVSAGGPREFCPAATATVTATVTDASGVAGELPSAAAQATAGITITVSSAAECVAKESDSGPGSEGEDAAPSGDLPVTGLHALCTGSWPSSGGSPAGPELHNGDAAVAIDPAGNLFVATVFLGAFGTVARAPANDGDLLVMKLDAQCHVLWTRQYGGVSQAIFDSPMIAADAAGDVIVAGSFQTGTDTFFGTVDLAVDLGAGPVTSQRPGAFVTKLDSSGKTLWVRTSIPAADGFADFVYDLAVDASGNAVFVFDGIPDFGAGTAADAGASVDLVKLDPDGNVVFARSSADVGLEAETLLAVDTAPDGSLWAAGPNPITGAVGAVHLSPAAAILSSVVLPGPTAPGVSVGSAVRVGSGGDVVLSGASGTGQTGQDWTRWFAAVASTGAIRWQSPTIDQPGTPSDPAQLVRVDADGNAWVAGELEGTLDLGAPVGVLSSPSANPSMDVVVYGPDGKVRSGTAIAEMTDPIVGDMTLGADRSVVLAGWDTDATGASTFFVSKLGF